MIHRKSRTSNGQTTAYSFHGCHPDYEYDATMVAPLLLPQFYRSVAGTPKPGARISYSRSAEMWSEAIASLVEFVPLLSFDAEHRRRPSQQSGNADRLARFLAPAVRTVLNT
jgi:hypothetical protein